MPSPPLFPLPQRTVTRRACGNCSRANTSTAADAVRILYGGSVTAANAADILALDNVDGALVGGASLTADKFAPIIEAATVASV